MASTTVLMLLPFGVFQRFISFVTSLLSQDFWVFLSVLRYIRSADPVQKGAGAGTHTHTVCQADYLRKVVEVLYCASRPDSHPVHLVVQAIQEETQELLSILLAAGHRNRNISSSSCVQTEVM